MAAGRLGRMLRGRRGAAVTAGVVSPARDWPALCRRAMADHSEDWHTLIAALRDASGAEEQAALACLGEASARLWPRLDAMMRSHAVAAQPRPSGGRLLPQVLRSMDFDGWVRQDAVRWLSTAEGPVVAYALALRTVDWVAPLRQDALAAVLARQEPEEVAAVVRMLLRLRRRTRAAGALDTYRAALTQPGQRRAVRRLAADADPATRRFGVRLALELGEYVRGDLVRTVLRDDDQVCRRLCAERLLELDPDQAGRLMWARSAAVRELAVAALPDDVPAARLVGPLADRSRIVRAQARWKLYERGEPPIDVYRAQLRRCGRSSPAHLVAGLAAGLGECGDGTDLPTLGRLVTAEPPAWESGENGGLPWPPVVRRAAVRALGRLATADVLVQELVPLLNDQAPSVAREASHALMSAAPQVPGEAAEAALDRPEPPVHRAALRLIRAQGPWRRLEVDLRLAADPRSGVAGEAVSDLRSLLSTQVYSRPDPDQSTRIQELLAAVDLPESVRQHLTFVLR